MRKGEHAPLETQALGFRYRGGPDLFTGFSERFHAGEVVAITGPSGRGKSTLMYLLGLLLRPTSGDVLIGGTQASHLNDLQRSRLRATQFGFVFQDAALDGTRSVLDNVCETALYRGESVRHVRGRAYELLERFGVGLRATAKPGQVSGGQAQRIALVRALVHQPPVLLCDEPTGNLDEASTKVVLHALRDHANEGGVVIVVTHTSSVVAGCDREVRL